MSEPLSAKDTGYPVFNLLVMRVPISMKTNMTLIIHTLDFIYFHDTYHLLKLDVCTSLVLRIHNVG